MEENLRCGPQEKWVDSDKTKKSEEDNGFQCFLESVEGGVEDHLGDSNCGGVLRVEEHGDPCGWARSR